MVHLSHFLKHETKKKVLSKFILLLTILVIYFIFMAIKHGLRDGFMGTMLTWSFFVFCTPIADAGFLLDFPIRLILKIRMMFSEIFVWIFAMILNILAMLFSPEVYQKTDVLKVFHQILTHPYPFWGIIILSGIGTFFSIYFGDELIDVINHKDRKKFQKHIGKYTMVLIGFVLLIGLIIFTYAQLLQSLNIHHTDLNNYLQ